MCMHGYPLCGCINHLSQYWYNKGYSIIIIVIIMNINIFRICALCVTFFSGYSFNLLAYRHLQDRPISIQKTLLCCEGNELVCVINCNVANKMLIIILLC